MTTVPTLSTSKLAAVPLTVKANATAKQKKEPVKKVPNPIPADVSASCALDFKVSKGTEIKVKQDDIFERVQDKQTAVVSKVEQDEAFKGVQATHLETTPQRNKVTKEYKPGVEDEVEFEDVDWKILSPVM